METINELKKICGKQSKSFRAKIYRNTSYYFTWLLLKLKFTANQVSALGLILGLLSAVLFATGNYLLFMIASLLFFFSELADYSDGEVARYRTYKKLPDEPLRQFGGFFDALNHIPRPVIFLCLAVSFIDEADPLLILSIGFMSAVFCYLDSGFFSIVDNISKMIYLKNYKKTTYKSKTSIMIRNHFYSLLLAPLFLGITSMLDFMYQINATFYLWIVYGVVGGVLFLSKTTNNISQ